MKHGLHYGRITWSYDEDFDPQIPCRPCPLITYVPIKIHGKYRTPKLSDPIALQLLKLNSPQEMSFAEAYKNWYASSTRYDESLSEGRSFLKWMRQHRLCIRWKPDDFSLHQYFTRPGAPQHDPCDELAQGLSFSVRPVEVHNRKVKLYLQDEDVLNLIAMPYGDDYDFMKLVEEYITLRFRIEKWKAPAPTFLDWVKSQAKRPVFSTGQLGFSLEQRIISMPV